MQEFKITQEQLQFIVTLLAEFPAKHVIQGIDLLRNLQPIVAKNEEKLPTVSSVDVKNHKK